MSTKTEDPYQRSLRLARERKSRWRERHPDKPAAYKARYGRAAAKFRQRHHDEYLTIAKVLRADGEESKASYRLADAELRRRHPQEWTDTLAATS